MNIWVEVMHEGETLYKITHSASSIPQLTRMICEAMSAVMDANNDHLPLPLEVRAGRWGESVAASMSGTTRNWELLFVGGRQQGEGKTKNIEDAYTAVAQWVIDGDFPEEV
jgi:hypothetical protein